jgi:hypothetical protein
MRCSEPAKTDLTAAVPRHEPPILIWWWTGLCQQSAAAFGHIVKPTSIVTRLHQWAEELMNAGLRVHGEDAAKDQ